MNTLELTDTCAAPWGTDLLRDISLRLEAGSVLALAGPNGAGKSSLLRLIAGDFSPSAGELRFRDRPLHSWSQEALARHLAFLPQMSLLNFPYTVEEVILLGRIPHDTGRRRDLEIAEEVMRLTDTSALANRLYTRLSGGEKQRTQLARVFAQAAGATTLDGQLLLLDEPTSALDLAHQQQVLEAVRVLADRGCAIVLAIHDLNLAATVAEQLLVLDQGRQVAHGSPETVLNPSMLRSVFGVEVTVGRHPTAGHPMIFPGAAPR
jgi:iron complex transport system ATP-binding protein